MTPLSSVAFSGDWAASVVVALAGALYGRGASALWRRAGVGAGVSVFKAAAFYLGLGALLVAVASPLDGLAHTLFSAHMAQHMVLVIVAAPLLAYGSPVLALLWALPRAARRAVGRAWNRAPGLRRGWRTATHPAVAWSLFTLTLWVWHLPSLYQLAVVSPLAHMLEHATLLGSAYLFWWVVIQPLGRRRLNHGAAILYVFAASFQATMLGTVLSLAPDPLYPVYAAGAAATGMTPIADQRLAAIVMRTPMMLVFLGAAAALFLRWMAVMEERASPRPRGKPASGA